MPRGSEHDRITRAFVGVNVPQVHRIMDFAVRVIGPRHQVIGHDRPTIEWMEAEFGPNGRKTAILHVLEDLRIVR